ncbi:MULTISPECIES: flagellar motor switch protein FliN [unclassified Iodobacter]|uniref:flagellar motor switch protein FliN n=1 Tax=unclassified Iodobacter TaxID=235634 RepID=UPI0025D7D4B8|nr:MULTISPECIES: flagellar motor switch protein FliN [unclassified Iodobacter]MDW5417403.1 flagellar motor switch protein FliN [Iodobacter sp. CM08]
MNMNEDFDLENALQEMESGEAAAAPVAVPKRDLNPFLRKIPVTLTLEVGASDISLAELLAIEYGSVLELNKLAGEPLDIKVNGTTIGKAEVVITGESYGLRVVELDHLDLQTLAS